VNETLYYMYGMFALFIFFIQHHIPSDVERYLGKRLPSLPAGSLAAFTKNSVSGSLLNSIVYDRDHDALRELGVAKALDRCPLPLQLRGFSTLSSPLAGIVCLRLGAPSRACEVAAARTQRGTVRETRSMG